MLKGSESGFRVLGLGSTTWGMFIELVVSFPLRGVFGFEGLGGLRGVGCEGLRFMAWGSRAPSLGV